jgi:dienelactone hydrolase
MIRYVLFALLVTVTASQAEIETRLVDYEAGGKKMQGFLAWDNTITGKRPGILVVHEWWGLNDYTRGRAKQLAGLGYTALAVDMFGGGKAATHPEDAQAFVEEVKKDAGAAKARFEAAMKVLKDQQTVDPKKIAAIGYCFGGGTVLSMARQGLDLAAVVSFHGSLGGLAPVVPPVKAKILVCNGADDSFVTQEQIDALKKEMAGIDFTFKSYPGAKHGFTNPASDVTAKDFGMKVGYNKEADEQSWKDMVSFLKAAFAREPRS